MDALTRTCSSSSRHDLHVHTLIQVPFLILIVLKGRIDLVLENHVKFQKKKDISSESSFYGIVGTII